MDHGRYTLHPGWETNSALEGYAPVNERDFRPGGPGPYSGNGPYSNNESFPREPFYGIDPYPHGRGEMYPQPVPPVWPSVPPRNLEDEYRVRDTRRHDPFHDMDLRTSVEKYREIHEIDSYRLTDNHHRDSDYRDSNYHRDSDYGYDRHRRSREDSRERDRDFRDSDFERGRREGSWRRRESRDSRDRERERRGLSREKDASPYRRRDRSRDRSREWSRDRLRSRSQSRSRSPRSRDRGRSRRREDSYDRYERRERERSRDRYLDERSYADSSSVQSATLIVRGLSQRTTEDDLYRILAEWGPLRDVRVIKERGSGISRGFAFIDLPNVESARKMMDSVGESGIVVDGRKLLFDYSKPTGAGAGFSIGNESISRAGYGNRAVAAPCDWICIICGCVNFARRTSCFQCNEPRTEDSPSADAAGSTPILSGKRGSDSGPTHVLVVRGLDENADEEMLRYEFAKHAPVRDLRLVRDKFTHVSRGFAFVHFNTVEDATRALVATNGIALERNGQVLRVTYAKNIQGPGPGPGPAQSSNLAAAAIEAATFAQQYDSAGWVPKEYNPNSDEKNNTAETQPAGAASQPGFVWDEKSGYYYDSTSGFYYDGNTGLYYDSNTGVWYSYDQQTRQYVPCSDQTNNNKPSGEPSGKSESSSASKKAVISAPAVTVKPDEKASLPDAVQAAANAALAAEKKEKERQKEIKLASKSSLLANKKKMNNVLAMWKQRNQEGQSAKEPPPSSIEDKPKSDPAFNATVTGVIRGSGKAFNAPPTAFSTTVASVPDAPALNALSSTPFKTDASALGSYAPVQPASGVKRRFSEAPAQSNQMVYRDRAAERRNLYGSTSSSGNDLSALADTNVYRKGSSETGSIMPFPPGVGVRSTPGESSVSMESYEVINADRAINESNVGNRMLRNMGWQEGLGLGKDGSGIKEPVQAKAVDDRAGLGSQQRKVVDPLLEAQAGDSYRTILQKKAIARFREMS